MEHISSYSQIYQIGHRAISTIFNTPVTVEEKIDGSQFSFGKINGELMCRSKNKDMIVGAHEKMFNLGVETIQRLEPILVPGWIYRGEFLAKPKHNALSYDRVPNGNIIIFDIMTAPETYMPYEQKLLECNRLELECVPLLFEGIVSDFDTMKGFLDRTSILGGQKIEGFVVKNYELFTLEKKVAMGKYVSEAYKEVAGSEWKKANPTTQDIVGELITRYRTPARWSKAVQHLRDAGELDESPKDIGGLIREVATDVHKECQDEIKDILFAHFWKNIARGLVVGLPEWYKEQLGMSSFEDSKDG